MDNLFEALRKKLEVDGGKHGVSAWDLAGLPATQRLIIRLILRDVQMAYSELHDAIARQPPAQRVDTLQLDEALAALVEEAWLIRIGHGPRAIYRVNLRRKAASRLGASIWERLDERIAGEVTNAPGE